MVDVSSATGVGEVAIGRVAAPPPVVRIVATAAAEPAAQPLPSPLGDTAQTSGLAQSMAASAPVDTDRVAKIKKAIADGHFPILPATIADRLIALKLQWHPNDAAGHDGSDEQG